MKASWSAMAHVSSIRYGSRWAVPRVLECILSGQPVDAAAPFRAGSF
jgi:hypothetical protein